MFSIRAFDVAACVAALALSSAAQAQNPVLTLEGVCPGEMTVTVTGARGARTVLLGFARREGRTLVPLGMPCAGTVLGLEGRTLWTVLAFRTDESGTGHATAYAGNRACGGFLQALVNDECEVTNVIQIPE